MSDTPAPCYRVIEQDLRRRIRDLPPHTRVASEARLCAEFGVSRMTARAALTRLVEAGLVYREAGRGSFVAPPAANRRADSLVRFTEQMRREGRAAASRVLAAGTRPATPAERLALRLGGQAVIEVRRVRLADGVPVAVETAVFPAVLAGLLDADLTGSLHAALARRGHLPSGGRATVVAEPATAEDAALLGVPAGAAVLVERRLVHDQRGHPLERTESRYAGDRYALDVRFEVDRP